MAQRTTYHEQPEKLFNQGKEMFLEGNYTAAQELLAQFSSESNDDLLKEEAAYMSAVSSFHTGNERKRRDPPRASRKIPRNHSSPPAPFPDWLILL